MVGGQGVGPVLYRSVPTRGLGGGFDPALVRRRKACVRPASVKLQSEFVTGWWYTGALSLGSVSSKPLLATAYVAAVALGSFMVTRYAGSLCWCAGVQGKLDALLRLNHANGLLDGFYRPIEWWLFSSIGHKQREDGCWDMYRQVVFY